MWRVSGSGFRMEALCKVSEMWMEFPSVFVESSRGCFLDRFVELSGGFGVSATPDSVNGRVRFNRYGEV